MPKGKQQIHRGGAPKHNRNPETHGLHTLKTAVKQLGSRTIDRRTKVGRELAEWREALTADLGGDLSVQQAALVELAVRTKLLLDSLDSYLLSLGGIVNKRKRSLWPVVKERAALVNQLQSLLRDLGLERKARDVSDLGSYLATRAQEPTPEPGTRVSDSGAQDAEVASDSSQPAEGSGEPATATEPDADAAGEASGQ